MLSGSKVDSVLNPAASSKSKQTKTKPSYRGRGQVCCDDIPYLPAELPKPGKGCWTIKECEQFERGMRRFPASTGQRWKNVRRFLLTRTGKQIASHARTERGHEVRQLNVHDPEAVKAFEVRWGKFKSPSVAVPQIPSDAETGDSMLNDKVSHKRARISQEPAETKSKRQKKASLQPTSAVTPFLYQDKVQPQYSRIHRNSFPYQGNVQPQYNMSYSDPSPYQGNVQPQYSRIHRNPSPYQSNVQPPYSMSYSNPPPYQGNVQPPYSMSYSNPSPYQSNVQPPYSMSYSNPSPYQSNVQPPYSMSYSNPLPYQGNVQPSYSMSYSNPLPYQGNIQPKYGSGYEDRSSFLPPLQPIRNNVRVNALPSIQTLTSAVKRSSPHGDLHSVEFESGSTTSSNAQINKAVPSSVGLFAPRRAAETRQVTKQKPTALSYSNTQTHFTAHESNTRSKVLPSEDPTKDASMGAVK